ncbi:hypothetical protein CBL_07094 [Carabus blaptoides fortunei]
MIMNVSSSQSYKFMPVSRSDVQDFVNLCRLCNGITRAVLDDAACESVSNTINPTNSLRNGQYASDRYQNEPWLQCDYGAVMQTYLASSRSQFVAPVDWLRRERLMSCFYRLRKPNNKRFSSSINSLLYCLKTKAKSQCYSCGVLVNFCKLSYVTAVPTLYTTSLHRTKGRERVCFNSRGIFYQLSAGNERAASISATTRQSEPAHDFSYDIGSREQTLKSRNGRRCDSSVKHVTFPLVSQLIYVLVGL